jgi:hypothetical protein
MHTLGDPGGDSGHSVTVGRIDDVIDDAKIESVDLVKMDIEGSEYGALLGARKLMAKHRPTVLIELNESALKRRGNTSDDVKQLFHEAGYKGWIVSRRGLSPIDRTGTHDCDECLFIHESAEDLLAKITGERKGRTRCA